LVSNFPRNTLSSSTLARPELYSASASARGEANFWSDGGYIGTVGDGVMADIIRNYVETQGTPEEKEGYKQMNLLDFG